jgi:transposase
MHEFLYCGLDLHKRFSYIVLKDSDGRQLIKGKINNDTDELTRFFAPFKHRCIKVAIEAASNYYWMFETLDTMGLDVKLSHPLKTKMIAESKIKSDKIDANILSDLLRTDFLPISYIPNQKIRTLREILRHRIRLVSARTQLKNRLRDILTKNNYQDSYTDITGIRARKFIEQLSLLPVFKIQCDDILDQIDFINKKIEKVNRIIKTYSQGFSEIERLTAIHGIGIFSALVLLAEIGDIHRFSSPKKLIRYAGLCPGLHQSGETYYHRPITNEGDRYLRWILSEAAQHAVRHQGPLKDFYLFLSKTKGKQKAIIAVARKMLTGIYFVLKDNKPFNPVRRKSYTNRIINLDKPAVGTWS